MKNKPEHQFDKYGDVPKYRKKKTKKTSPKSNHKHEFVPVEILSSINIIGIDRAGNRSPGHVVRYIQRCLQCGKEKSEINWSMNTEQYEKLIEIVRDNNGCDTDK